jgi:glycerol-3-phosphate acyltransferase PlsY
MRSCGLLRGRPICYELRSMTSELLCGWLLGYLFGSMPFGLLLTRLAGKGDVRKIGSGNIGATNVLRAGGKRLAAATLILDCLKATAAILLAGWLWPGSESFAAAGALIGHLYPVWLKFRGGKGVATFLGILIPLLPVAAVVYAVVWLGLLLAVRISSVAGMAAAASAPITAAVLGNPSYFPMLLGFALLVIWKHRTNILRLKAGTEPRIGKGKV